MEEKAERMDDRRGDLRLNFLRGLIGMGHPLHNGVMIFDLVLFILFFALRKDFCARPDAGTGSRP